MADNQQANTNPFTSNGPALPGTGNEAYLIGDENNALQGIGGNPAMFPGYGVTMGNEQAISVDFAPGTVSPTLHPYDTLGVDSQQGINAGTTTAQPAIASDGVLQEGVNETSPFQPTKQ